MNWLSPRTRQMAIIAIVVSTAPTQAGAGEATDHTPGGARAPKEPQPAAPAQGDSDTSGYFRFDYDSYGLQLWVGATHQIGGIQIASDVYVTDSFGEVDFGPQFTLGDVTLIATVGCMSSHGSSSRSALRSPKAARTCSTRATSCSTS